MTVQLPRSLRRFKSSQSWQPLSIPGGRKFIDPKRQTKTSVVCTLYRFYKNFSESCRLDADKSQSFAASFSCYTQRTENPSISSNQLHLLRIAAHRSIWRASEPPKPRGRLVAVGPAVLRRARRAPQPDVSAHRRAQSGRAAAHERRQLHHGVRVLSQGESGCKGKKVFPNSRKI
jgi:hypothetical protein